jgi:ABC-type amino acid transport substrate-binding protein
VVVAAALVLAGCSSTSSTPATSSAPAPASSEAAMPASSEAAPASSAAAMVDPAALGLNDPTMLTVGMTLQFKPQMYKDDSGNPAGYDVALLKKLAADMGVTLDIKDLDFNGLIPGLQSGQFDLVSVGLTNTPERAESIDFTREYVPYAQILVAKAGSNPSTNLDDWNNPDFKIAALQGSTAASLITKDFPKATLVEFPDQTAAFLEVATGRADALVVESYLFDQYNASNPDQLEQVQTEAPLNLEYGSWAVQKGKTDLVNYLNTWLCTAQADGTLADAYQTEQGGQLPPMPETC